MTARLVISQHNQLGGLVNDDHVQYLRIDGFRAMTGNLDMGGNNILNSGNILINSDTKGLFLGEEQDVLFGYDGINCNLDCSLVEASDCYIKCGPQKTVILDNTVWEDLRVPLTTGKPGLTRPPSFLPFMDNGVGSVGVMVWSFANQSNPANEQEIFFIAQLPHAYKQETNIIPHIHWSPVVSGLLNQFVKWGLEYTWVNHDGTFGNTVIITSDATTGATATTSGDTTLIAKKHYLTEIGSIAGTGKNISSILVCRLFRNSSHIDDDLNQAAFGFEIDFHFSVDTMGSRQELIK